LSAPQAAALYISASLAADVLALECLVFGLS
jgi:hypothetical protein